MMEDNQEGLFSDAEEENFNMHSSNGKPAFYPIVEEHMNNLVIDDGFHGNNDNNKNSDDSNEDKYSDDDNEYDCEWDYEENGSNDKIVVRNINTQRCNAQSASKAVSKYQPIDNLLGKFMNKINIEKYERPLLEGQERIREKDVADRATAEQVWDRSTTMIVYKLANRNIIDEIYGSISTGKEANVYYTKSGDQSEEYAVKIYMTSGLKFKNRDVYITGEHRYRHGYKKSTARQMIKTWAEKEARNLQRIASAGIKAPRVIVLRENVLVMDFLGKNGWAAPKLKDTRLSEEKYRELYRDCIVMMWKMYHNAKLVHADLSEYNMLYHDRSLYFIDVSQSVEHDHPKALEFLGVDCNNVTAYFKKNNVAVLSARSLFDFIRDPSIVLENLEAHLDKLSEEILENDDSEPDEEVLVKSYFPQRLDQIKNIEEDEKRLKAGKNDLIHKTLVGIKTEISKQEKKEEEEKQKKKEEKDRKEKKKIKEVVEEDDEDEEDEEDEEEEEEEEEEEDEAIERKKKSKFVNSGRDKNESAQSKKERKKAVKEQQAEKRKTKVKKYDKKKANDRKNKKYRPS